ncbi:MAG: RNA polymerase sigma factor [Chloroflexota bacterium]|nr:RNA polymerase sigma factor [Chloroflexota bacterium]
MQRQLPAPGASDEFELEAVLPAERERLVRLCARLSGDLGAAEDLAQETLIEAWRHAGGLRDAGGYRPWLSAIALNVCLRWRRSRGREQARVARLAQAGPTGGAVPAPIGDESIGDADPGVALEREELADLLDRALALLPAETRDLLLERYVAERPPARIAARLGLSEGAVATRLHRGRLALRRVLTGELRREAALYAPAVHLAAPAAGPGWEETPIWCPQCGRRRLRGRFSHDPGEFELRCPDCYPRYGVNLSERAGTNWFRALFAGVKGYKPALNRMARNTDRYLRPALTTGVSRCLNCGRRLPVRLGMAPTDPPEVQGVRGVHCYCRDCQVSDSVRLTSIALYLPDGRRFWRAHPRMRLLPEREIERDGRAALVIGYESLTAAARFDVVVARDTYAVLHAEAPDDGPEA